MSSKMSALLSCLISTVILGILSVVHGKSVHKKPPLLTIKTQHGQVYDCVDFYEQPTLKHPWFKNHIHDYEVNITALQSQVHKVKGVGLKDDGCPLGTVPILRSYNISMPSSPFSFENFERHCIAAVRTSGHGDKFYGAVGTVSVFKSVAYGNQWTTARMKLINIPDFIEAGWMVNPSLYKDDEAHFYAKFQSQYAGGCFNLLCPGFVQVSKQVPLGIIPDHYSKIGQDHQYVSAMAINKHKDDGHWWLTIDNDNKPVGYWPWHLFASSLRHEASQIEWGGEMDNPESQHVNPPYIGSGLSARQDTRKSAFYCRVKAAVGYAQYDSNPGHTEKFQECDMDQYKVYDSGYQGDFWGRLMFFGGPYPFME